jgi:F420-dependent oxidoreductase-like protein
MSVTESSGIRLVPGAAATTRRTPAPHDPLETHGETRMQVGIHFMNFTLPGAPDTLGTTLARTARAADEGGAAWLTMMDHWFQMEHFATAHDPMLEGYTSLGFAAGQTERLKLGLLVTGVTYRYPGLLAKTVTTLDVLSGGRAMLGIGAAWYEREHRALGVPYPALAERFERLEEALEICLQMWSDDEGPYQGTHYQLAETICVPAPISRPHPPILIGGSGEKKTLRLVARFGDACNLIVGDASEAAHKLDVLRRHCDDVGTDYAAITKSVLIRGLRATDQDVFLRTAEELQAVGIELITVAPNTPDPVGFTTELCEKLLPRLQEI